MEAAVGARRRENDVVQGRKRIRGSIRTENIGDIARNSTMIQEALGTVVGEL